MALLMLGSEEYSQQVVKHQNCSQNSANLIMYFQKKNHYLSQPLQKGLAISWRDTKNVK